MPNTPDAATTGLRDERPRAARARARRRALSALCIVAVTVALSGCTMPAGTGLKRAMPAAAPCARRAWLSRVEIADWSVDNKSRLEDSLTLNILEYMREGRYFADANVLPGKPGRDDVVLRFRFDRYELRRSPHPAYFPGALLTLTLYIWVGGPIFTDRSDLAATLVVEDAGGARIASETSQVFDEHSVSLWSSEYVLPSGVEARTSIVKELLAKAVAAIGKTGGAKQ